MSFNTSLDGTSKKNRLEDLTKEELIIKCKGLLTLAQKAKQAKDALINENNKLKEQVSNCAADEFTSQQKLLTSEEVTRQNESLENKCINYETQLRAAEKKILEIERESVSHQKQVSRLTDENNKLVNDLGQLEMQIEELKEIGLEQQAQLLALEKSDVLLPPTESNCNFDGEEIKQLKSDLIRSESVVSACREDIAKYVSEIDDLNAELHKCQSLVDNLKQDNINISDSQIASNLVISDLENCNEKLKDKLKFYHSKMIQFVRDVKYLKQAKQELLSTFSTYIGQVSDWKVQLKVLLQRIEENQVEMHETKLQNESLKMQLVDLEKDNVTLKDEILLAENVVKIEREKYVEAREEIKEYILRQDGILKLQEIVDVLMDKCNKNNATRSHFIKQYENDMRLLMSKCNILNDDQGDESNDFVVKEAIMQKNETERIELNTFINQLHINMDKSNSFESYLDMKLEGLLKLMREVLMQLENKLYESEKSNEDLGKLKRENTELLLEMNEMNQALKERGETISKQQTYCDTLLKKLQSTEAQPDTENLKDELIKALQQELQSLRIPTDVETTNNKDEEITQLKNEIQELQKKLLQIDEHHQDIVSIAESEIMSTSTVSRIEEVSRMKDLESSWEERYSKLRNLAVKLKSKTRDLTTDLSKEQSEKSELQQKLTKTIQTFQQQTDKMQDQLETTKQENRSCLKKLESLALEINKDKQQLIANEELISKLKTENENLSKDKHNIENWKKQVSSKVQGLKKELEANALIKKDFETKINKLNSDLEAKESALKNEIDKYNQVKSTLQESHDECKKLSLLNLELHDYERIAKEMSQELDKKQELITNLKSQIDSYKTNLSDVENHNKLLEDNAKSLENNVTCVKNENDHHLRKLLELEKQIVEKDYKIQNLSHTLENCKLENEDFARQLSDTISEHQKINNSLQIKEDHLKSQNLGLEQKLREIQETLKLREDALSEVRNDYENYKIRAKSVMQQSRDFGTEEKLTEETARLRAQVEALKDEVIELRLTIDHEKTETDVLKLQNQKLLKQIESTESIIEENKAQYEQLLLKNKMGVTEHAETVRGLKIHIDTLTECYRQQLSDQETRHSIEISELQSHIGKGLISSNIPSFAPPSMIREEGEGSESIDSSHNNSTNLMSLEKLLSTETDREVCLLKKQLQENNTKVSHLAALLADAEQDLAKHVQMNKVLKEEVRRQQRCVEREEHAENLEYLKNVVFKFLTLGNGDERSRLVPVLNTILKLSPDENRKLATISRGDKSWSNYLPGGWGS